MPGNVPYPPHCQLPTAHSMQEPPSTSPSPTTRSDADLGDDEEDNTPPVKRKAIQSPVSVPRPQKVPRFDNDDQRGRRAGVSSGKRTNGAPTTSLTQAPNIAKKPRSSFLSQPARVPPARPEKTGKNCASSGQSSSSLSDNLSNMLQKQNARYRRIETARKKTGSRGVSTSDLIRAAQKSSSKFSLIIVSFSILTSIW